ncbi:hypothetical protein P280DRAFT_41692 [Massarina eburnea CBS 473.64]|uniref:Uncharacterized protein n=1 Tax=Massarina eburnea CBS 473.64 TaxID=1395130 RepID=A0A6A6RWT8_9PLEO|nr:hypothetical protein P280DRAFT_41692 [Massarina eburnea CBS 473.64]
MRVFFFLGVCVCVCVRIFMCVCVCGLISNDLFFSLALPFSFPVRLPSLLGYIHIVFHGPRGAVGPAWLCPYVRWLCSVSISGPWG